MLSGVAVFLAVPVPEPVPVPVPVSVDFGFGDFQVGKLGPDIAGGSGRASSYSISCC